MKPDIFAPIIPEVEAGGFYLGTHISDIVPLILEKWRPLVNDNYRLSAPFTVFYSFEDCIHLGYDILSGLLTSIICTSGYKGRLFTEIVVGDEIKVLRERLGGSLYKEDDVDEYIYIKDQTGVSIQPEDPNADIGSDKPNKIHSITIFRAMVNP